MKDTEPGPKAHIEPLPEHAGTGPEYHMWLVALGAQMVREAMLQAFTRAVAEQRGAPCACAACKARREVERRASPNGALPS